jgi:hypothetical protein
VHADRRLLWLLAFLHHAPPFCIPARLRLQVSDEIHSGALFGCLRFSLDGSLLLAVAEGRIYLLDSFEGRLLQKVSWTWVLWLECVPHMH